MRQLAASRGGKCLSNEYINAHTKLKWQCADGHIWESIPASVKQGCTWCPFCAGTSRLTIEEMQSIDKLKVGHAIVKMKERFHEPIHVGFPLVELDKNLDNFDFNKLKRALIECGFVSVKKYNWWKVEHSGIDDYSKAYLPHKDKKGILVSLNVEATK